MIINKFLHLPELLKRLWSHLSERRRREFSYLFGLMLLGAVLEAISLGAVLPFLGVLVAPKEMFYSPFVVDAAKFWGITNEDELVLFFSATFIIAALVAGAVSCCYG